uniref:Uncharacterized protein n=1 Tax=Ornithorhynchus anatinus TaxID=9258 RepID=A0A6I8NUQ8_ORNAN
MADVRLVSATCVSKGPLTPEPSAPPGEAPTFTLPPRNLCVPEGSTARFEGKVSTTVGSSLSPGPGCQ